MCGRYALPIEPQYLPEAFGRVGLEVNEQDGADSMTYHRYNIGPTETAPVYMVRLDSETQQRYRRLQYARWGVIPTWVHDTESLKKNRYPTFNARYEGIGQSRLWRTIVNKRCVVPVAGYYEWHKDEKTGRKQPYYVTRKDGKLMFLAGIYSHSYLDDKKVYSYTVITWTAPKCLEWLHERMPVVLDPEEDLESFNAWLSPDTQRWEDVKEDLHVYAGNSLEWYPVDPAVGNTRVDKVHFVKPWKAGQNDPKDPKDPKKKEVSVKQEHSLLDTIASPKKRRRRVPESPVKVKLEPGEGLSTESPPPSPREVESTPLKSPRTPKKSPSRSSKNSQRTTLDRWASPKKRTK